ncbi:hypothetical protein BCR39DRAFT_579518 [Naematelia encephala]|uniref:Uncharacterized protein n=1 Tax=Naematelia encephala TaxID=71784 RepID=A0A1Y2AW82_9TREE|nr:hypothetical protein BCR39DRAFT_579518 [Naematelia encephala]
MTRAASGFGESGDNVPDKVESPHWVSEYNFNKGRFPTMVKFTITCFSALVGALPFLIGLTNAQNASPSASASASLSYPEWWTNDYPCVIQCMQNTFNGQTPPATQDQQNTALGCVSSTCNNATAAANYYQGTYIIRMFNAKGSIYEENNLAASAVSQSSDTSSSSDSSDSSDTDTPGPTPTDSSAPTLTASDVGVVADADVTSTTDFVGPAGAPTAGSSTNPSASHSAGAGNGTTSGAAGRASGLGSDVKGLTGLALAIGLGVGGGVAFGL